MSRQLTCVAASAAVTIALLTGGCVKAPGQPFAIPDTPDGTVRAVMSGLAAHHPEVLWRALPASYQGEVSTLVRSFADTVDPVLHERMVAVTRKGVVVLQAKKDLVMATDSVRGTGLDAASVDATWEAAVHAADAVLASEIADLEALRELDVEAFLATTGAAVMDQLAAVPPIGDDGEDLATRLMGLAGAEVDLVAEESDWARVRVTVPGEAPKDLEMVRVDNRWLPVELVDRWRGMVDEAASRIRWMGSDEAAQAKVTVLLGLGLAEGFIDQISRVESAEELDRLVGGFLGSVLQSQRGTATPTET